MAEKMAENLGDDLKRLILAGIGAAALTSEKARQMIDEFVKKGELTVEQGKVLNEELRRDIRRKVKESVTVNVTAPQSVEDIAKAASRLTPEELSALKKKIEEAEAARQADTARNTESAKKDNAGV